MATNTIVEKIAKLLALGKSSNENEAMAALGKAQKLMSQYSISQSDVDNVAGKLGNDFVKQTITLNQTRFAEWEKYLIMYISESNFCKVVFYTNSDMIDIYGTNFDSEMVIALYAFIRPQMVKFASVAHKASFTSINGKEWKASYYAGMNTKIHMLLKEVLQITATEETNGTAIVLKKNELVKTFFEDNKDKVVTKKKRDVTVGAAFSLGYQDGDKLQLGIEKRNGMLA